MRNPTDIKARMKSVAETRQITGAMETVSVAKMRKTMVRYENNRAYFETLRRTIADIAAHTSGADSKYLRPNHSGNAVYIVIASDKGLAGGFNHNVLEYALDKIEHETRRVGVFCVGQMARAFFERRTVTVDVAFVTAAYDPSVRDAREIADSVRNLYDGKTADAVYVVYTHLNAGGGMEPRCIPVLPLSKDLFVLEDDSFEAEDSFRELEFDPSPEEVMERLVPQYLTGILYGALIQSTACEHRARREAMHSATLSADEILESLGMEYHRARQEAVTDELSEIITAAARWLTP